VGRAPLDEDAIRLIEESNPDLEFDWTRILKGQDAPPEPPPVHHERRARPRPPELPSRQAGRPTAPAPARAPESPRDVPAPVVSAREVPVQQAPDPAVAADTESGLPAPTPASARLGPEGLSRLRARHAEVLARISEKITDPARRDQLKTDAERLNPDTWVTDAEVVAGLEGYETVFESLRGVIGRRRKRRRRRPGGAEQPSGAGPTEAQAPVAEPGDDDGTSDPNDPDGGL
jgi:hypothetical protein